MGSLALIGAGAMGEAILAGLIKAGVPAHEIGIIEKRAERSQELTSRYGVQELRDLQGVSHCFLVVKPNDMQTTLATYGPTLPADALVISIIAGKPTSLIESLIPQRVVRVMPNTPALVAVGMSGMSRGAGVSDSEAAFVNAFLGATGKVVEGGVAEQTRQTLINLQKILDVKGAKFADVVKVTAHLQDVNKDFAAYDAVYREFFTAPFPVRTTVGSDLIKILVEIDFVVAL